jgi:hypothetical protein
MIITGKTQTNIDDENTLKQIQDNADQAQALLSVTDWYIIRKLEKSIDIPQEILDARDNARTVIDSCAEVKPEIKQDLTEAISKIQISVETSATIALSKTLKETLTK